MQPTDQPLIDRVIGCALPLAFLFCSSCATIEEPKSRTRLERPWGFAAGANDAEAQQLADVVEQVLATYQHLDGFRPQPLRAHMVDDHMGEPILGVAVAPAAGDPWIAVRRDNPDLQSTVAHELAHFYFRDAIASLPAMLQEGVCDHLAIRVFGPSITQTRKLLFAATSYLDDFIIYVRGPSGRAALADLVEPAPSIHELFALEIGLNEALHLELDPATAACMYGLGASIADRVGFEGLMELVHRSDTAGHPEVPASWILDAAGLSPLTQDTLFELFTSVSYSNQSPGAQVFHVSLGTTKE